MNHSPALWSTLIIVVGSQIVEIVILHFGPCTAFGLIALVESIIVVFVIITVIVAVQGPNLMMEEVVKNELVDLVCEGGVAGVFINSQTSGLLNSLENIVFVIYNLGGVEPCVPSFFIHDLKDDSMSLEESHLRLYVMESKFEIGLHILIVPI